MLEEAREKFKADYFATEATGIVIEEVGVDFAKCSLKLEKKHMNAANTVMGGAIYTLADFAFAVASNAYTEEFITVSLVSQITYIAKSKGTQLIAEANCIKSGKSTCFFIVDVKDNLKNHVASVSINGFRKPKGI